MVSFQKLIKNARGSFRGPRKGKKKRNRKKALDKCPQKKGVCLKVYTTTPKKPNSGIRKVVKIKLSNRKQVIAQIPGIGHNLIEFNMVMVRGGRIREIPGLQYRVVRGKYDCKAVWERKTRRSLYGTKKNQKY